MAAVCISIPLLKAELSKLREAWRQDSVAWAVAPEAEFL